MNDIKVPEHHIRQRAFEIFIGRDQKEGNETTDWSQAEHELIQLNNNGINVQKRTSKIDKFK